MADENNLSVEEVLAACRRMDGEGGGEAAPESSPTPPAAEQSSGTDTEVMGEPTLAAQAAAASESAPAETAPAKKPGEMSVAEMLAAARAEKQKPAASAAPAKGSPAAKAAPAKPAAAKASPKAPAEPAGPKDTSSILAAARKSAKAGPVSRQEAARQQEPAPAKPGKPKLEVPPMPAKPEYAQTAPEPDRDGESRRGFFGVMAAAFVGSSLAVGFSTLAVTHLLWLLGFARFMFPNILIEPPTRFKVGFPDDYAPGQVEAKYKAQFGVWVVRYEYEGEESVYALRSVCTHLGCTPNWLDGEQKFKCPCHGSGFYKDGINFEGPAPRPLERYAISVADDGQLEVDKSRKFQEELGQWNDPASFVPV